MVNCCHHSIIDQTLFVDSKKRRSRAKYLTYDVPNGVAMPCTPMICARISRIALPFLVSIVMSAQQGIPPRTLPPEVPEDTRLPNGKLQREEILKADYQKTLEDARALSKLTDALKADLEKSDYNVLSLGTLKKIDDIDRLAKRIRDRLKR
jgi:hypothetical protein